MAKESQSALRRWGSLQWKLALLSLAAHLALALEFPAVARLQWLISLGLVQVLVAALTGCTLAWQGFARGRRKNDPEYLFLATEPPHLKGDRERRAARRRDRDSAEIQ